MATFRYSFLLLLLGACNDAPAGAPSNCRSADSVAVQVLGSGGPIADDDRASSGYLVWVNGNARVMIDAGNGTVLRFAEAGGRFEDLGFVGISHFHTDHSADFPALLKSGNFSPRLRPLRVAGPAGSARFPSLDQYLAGLLDPETGIYSYLSGYLDGSGGLVQLEPRTVSSDTDKPQVVFEDPATGLRIDALPVPHGIVPAIAFRVTARNRVVVFGSDQTLTSDAYTEFARDADLLVAHMVIPESATGTANQLHARPSAIGSAAADSDVDALLLGHFMQRSLRDLEGNLAAVREEFDGEIVLATDLGCVPLDTRHTAQAAAD